MKPGVLVFILFLAYGGAAARADDESLGATVGFSFNDATVGDPASGSSGVATKSRGTLHVGALYCRDIGAPWELRTGLIYSDRDYDQTVEASGTRVSQTIKLGYIEVPANIQYNLENTKWDFYAGLIFAFKYSNYCMGTGCYFETTPMTLFGNIGTDYFLRNIFNGRIFLSLEYQQGLSNINATPGSAVRIVPTSIVLGAVWKTAL